MDGLTRECMGVTLLKSDFSFEGQGNKRQVYCLAVGWQIEGRDGLLYYTQYVRSLEGVDEETALSDLAKRAVERDVPLDREDIPRLSSQQYSTPDCSRLFFEANQMENRLLFGFYNTQLAHKRLRGAYRGARMSGEED